jgi:pyridoxal 5'-phosphate synthase pdxT subunit
VAGRVGVLALQGAFREHVRALGDVGLEAVEVRVPDDMDGLAGLVVPGGESTTMSKLIADYALERPIRDLHAGGGALLGTCAGMIVLAASAVDGRSDQRPLGLIDIDVRRNAYGRQTSSFEAPLRLAGEDLPFPGVFIRAPRIERLGERVETVAEHDGVPVAARQGTVLVTAFHPELTGDRRVHGRFAAMVTGGRKEAAA